MLVESQVVKHWWTFAVRGLVAILFGVLAFIWPDITLAALVLLWAAYALVDGVVSLVAAFRSEHGDRLGLILEGIVGIAAGVGAFILPGLTALVLVYIIAAWALITGALELYGALRMWGKARNEWLLALAGLASIVFGIALMVAPGPGAVALIWVIGSYAIVFGILLIAVSVRLHGMVQRRSVPRAA